SIATADAVGFVVSNRGMLSAFGADHRVLWEHDLGARSGSARATVAIAGGRVFAVEHAHSRAKLLALDVQTGEAAWTHDLGRAEPEQNPLIAANAVYVGAAADGQRGQWHAFRVDSGAPLWTAPLDHPPGAATIAGGKLCAIAGTSIACVETG